MAARRPLGTLTNTQPAAAPPKPAPKPAVYRCDHCFSFTGSYAAVAAHEATCPCAAPSIKREVVTPPPAAPHPSSSTLRSATVRARCGDKGFEVAAARLGHLELRNGDAVVALVRGQVAAVRLLPRLHAILSDGGRADHLPLALLERLRTRTRLSAALLLGRHMVHHNAPPRRSATMIHYDGPPPRLANT